MSIPNSPHDRHPGTPGPKRHGHAHGHAHGRGRSLADCPAGETVRIALNRNPRTLGMGLFRGAPVHIRQNHPGSPSLIIGVGPARFVLDRRTAAAIRVQDP